MVYIDQETKKMIATIHEGYIQLNQTVYGKPGTKDNGLCGDVVRNINAVERVNQRINRTLLTLGATGISTGIGVALWQLL